MVILGLTGGIACGKSAVAERLRQRGAQIIDADVIARQVVAPGTPGLQAVIQRFGAEYLSPDGMLLRGKLGQRVFADPADLSALEGLLHPLIHAEIAKQLADAARTGQPLAVVDAALLLEMGLDGACDATVTVEADPELQITRLASREGMPRDQAVQRLAAQATADHRRARTTWAIDNRGTLADLDRAVDQLMQALAERFAVPMPEAAASSASLRPGQT